MGEKFAKLKEENKILIMLAFYSISIGIWNNFKQLWLQDNNLDVARNKPNIKYIWIILCNCIINVFHKDNIK